MQVPTLDQDLAHQVPARIKVGFDRTRARELQWLFTNAHVPARSREHVLDSFMGFADALGVRRGEGPRWDVPLPSSARAYAEHLIPDSQPTLLISACSSHRLRNWRPDRYAAVADYAAVRHGMRVILCGGPSDDERDMAAAIVKRARTPLVNQVARDTLPELLALLSRSTVLLTP